MARSPEDNTRFASNMIAGMKDRVDSVEIITPYSFRVLTKSHLPCQVGVVSAAQVGADDVNRVLMADPCVEFIANIPKASIWKGAAIQILEERDIAFGPMKGLMSGICSLSDDWSINQYVHPETHYFQQILTQHQNFQRFVRVTDLVYEVHRKNGEPLLIAGMNEYELSAVAIRTAIASHGHVSIIFATNPNGKPTLEAHTAAESMGIELYHERRAFYHRVHKP